VLWNKVGTETKILLPSLVLETLPNMHKYAGPDSGVKSAFEFQYQDDQGKIRDFVDDPS
jgi:hypothetical protein